MAHELNIGTISGFGADELITQLVDLMVENKIGNVGKYDGLISGDIVLGNYVDMAGYTWRVCHIDEDASEFYLILNTISESTQFGSNNAYAGSTIATKCNEFLNELPAEVMNILLMKTVNGVTSKVWIPSYEQVNGGFDLFNSNTNRIAYDGSGAAQTWWTSSVNPSSSAAWRVSAYGDLNNPSNSNGFRPCLALKL